MSAPIPNNTGFTLKVECAFNAYLDASHGKALINSKKRAESCNFLHYSDEKITGNIKEDQRQQNLKLEFRNFNLIEGQLYYIKEGPEPCEVVCNYNAF